MKPLALVLLFPALALGVQRPHADKAFWKLVAADAAINALDVVTSVHAQRRGAYERNPMLPTHPSPARFSIQTTALSLGAYYALHRVNKHHPRLAKGLLVTDIAFEGACVGTNLKAGR